MQEHAAFGCDGRTGVADLQCHSAVLQESLDVGMPEAHALLRQTAAWPIHECQFCLEVGPQVQLQGESCQHGRDSLHEATQEACRTCRRCWDVTERQRWLSGNRVDIGVLPAELADLTWTEKLLIQVYAPTKSFVLLPGRGTLFRGNFLTVEQRVADWVRDLPRRVADLPIIVVRRRRYRRRSLGSVQTEGTIDLLVRRDRVLGALVWLQQHNFAYSNVVVWQDLLDLLPTDGIPPEMAAHVQYEDDAAAPADEAIGAPEPPPQGPEIAEALAEGSEAESAESDEAVVPDVDEGEEQRLAGEVEHAFVLQAPVANDDRQAVPQEVAARFGAVAPAAPAAEAEAVPGPERGEPVSELETPGFWAGTYPWIFPHGEGDFLHPLRRLPLARVVGRPTGLELRIWVRHLLGHRSHRAAADPRFVGHVLNVANRMEARRRATAFVHFAGQVGEDPNLWTGEHVRQLLGDRHSDLASCITSFAHTIPGSRGFWQAERGSLEALIQQRRRDSGLIPAYSPLG